MAAGSWTRILAALGAFDPGIEGEIWQQLDPIGQGLGMNAPLYVAVDNSNGNTYVTDHYNNRVLVFDFDGNSVPLANPIGATPGGSTLWFPEGIKVDASHQIIVGDSFNGRVAVFGSDGVLNFDVRIVDWLKGPSWFVFATGIAVTPGASVTGYQMVPQNSLNPNRLVVSDKYNCFVYIYDTDFYPIARLGSGNCDVTDGDFDVPEGVAVDAAGHIFVTDYTNSRINIYGPNGNYLGKFGEPPAAGAAPVDALQSPTDVLVSTGRGHEGRVVVADSANQRLAFYDVSFITTTPPAATATYQFSITALGGLSFPSGIAEDASHDPVGRLVVTDTGMNRIQRFQVPDLAVVQVTTDSSTTPPSGSFGVLVPVGKDPAGVVGVIPTIVGTNATVNLVPAPTPVDIHPGQIATYNFAYEPTGAPVSFRISAVGNCVTSTLCNTISNEAVATPAVPCTGCSSSAAVISPSGPPPASGWYPVPVTVRITANSSVGLSRINYIFSGPQGGLQPGLHSVLVSGNTASHDVVFSMELKSAVEFWAVDSNFTEEMPHHVKDIWLDLTPPTVIFHFENATPLPNADDWWNATSVSVPFTLSDESSATLVPGSPASPLVFTKEGANQTQMVSAVDAAGHRTDAWAQDNNGHMVNIDRTPPKLKLPASVTLELSSPAGSTLPAGTPFQATATDALSGMKSLNNPTPGVDVFPLGVTPWTFVAIDKAGNRTVGTRTVTVRDTIKPVLNCPATLTVPADAANAPLPDRTAATLFTDASGSVTLTQSPVEGTLVNGGPIVVTITGTDPSGNVSAPCTTSIIVNAVPPPPGMPTISVSVDPDTLWPPNHKMVTITAHVTASAPVTLVSIISSEPDDGLGDGDTPNDIQDAAYGTDDRVFQLRAERSGKGPGRTYTITYSATGSTGLVATATAKVTVPHDQGK